MSRLHNQKRHLSDDQLQQELEKRLKKDEQQDPEIRARVADALKNSKDKYIASQVEQARREVSDKKSDINAIGDNNNFKFNNRQFTARQKTAEIQEVENLSEEINFENQAHKVSAHQTRPEPTPRPQRPEWTQINDQELDQQREKSSGQQAVVGWTQAAEGAPKPEMQPKPHPEHRAELEQENRPSSPFQIPKLEALKTQRG